MFFVAPLENILVRGRDNDINNTFGIASAVLCIKTVRSTPAKTLVNHLKMTALTLDSSSDYIS